MTAQFEDETVFQHAAYDPFPQPQTIPEGWDVSVLSCAPEASGTAEELTETDSH